MIVFRSLCYIGLRRRIATWDCKTPRSWVQFTLKI
jgi:hypothetical protein